MRLTLVDYHSSGSSTQATKRIADCSHGRIYCGTCLLHLRQFRTVVSSTFFIWCCFVCFVMASRNLSEVEKAKIIAWRQDNLSMQEIANRLGRAFSTISRFVRSTHDMGFILQRKPHLGQARETSATTDNLLRREVMKEPKLTADDLQVIGEYMHFFFNL